MTQADNAAGGLLVVISGPSGAGKTTIAHAAVDRIDGAVFSISATTRPQSAKETDGQDYFFLTPQRFQQMIDAGDFLEHAEVFGNRYGTPRAAVDAHLAKGRVVVLEIDVAGAKQVKAARPDAFGVFILPPSEEELLARLRARKREAEDIIQRRFSEAKREILEAHESGVYDRMVTNRELQAAISETLEAILEARAAAT
ncbi:MAG: guanylate kinase [Planctomycetota bacterium]